MADEGGTRAQTYLQTGCNAFNQGKSLPIGFWTKQDILQYIVNNNFNNTIVILKSQTAKQGLSTQIHSFIQQVFIKHQLCTRHYSLCLGCSRK